MQAKRLIDYHLHSNATIDCQMAEEQVCERSLEMGIYEIAFTNHIMLTHPDYHITPEGFKAHWEQIQGCQERHPQMNIRLGIEIDYYLGRESEISATLQNYEKLIGQPFDFVLGTIHDLHGQFFSNRNSAISFYQQYDLLSLYHDYFDLSIKAVQSQLFDVIAHPDLIKKFSNDLYPYVPFESYRSAVEPFVDALLASDVGIELNTKGLSINLGEMYPSNEFLELYIEKARACGKEPLLTIGSDAHFVHGVGRNIAEGAAVIKKMGISSLAIFEKRRRSAYQL